MKKIRKKEIRIKKMSIIKKSVISLIILGVAILVGVCVVTSISFYHALVDEYTELAYSFVAMANSRMSSIDMDALIEQGDSLAEKMAAYGDDQDVTFSDEERELIDDWILIDDFLYEAIALNTNLENFQVIIPEEDWVTCIWNERSDMKVNYLPMERRSYRPGEAESIQHLFEEGDLVEEELSIVQDGEKIVGTAIWPVYYYPEDGPGHIVAYSEMDVSLTDIRTAILKLMLIITIFFVLVMGIALIIYFVLLKKNLIMPIVLLESTASGVVDKLKNGEEPVKTDIHTGDEIEALAHSLENMEENLRGYIDENAVITAERERLSTELDLAASIQEDMLPSVFPPFPDRKEFEVFASMTPAKEVGGDFYDFFFIDDNTLAMVIADVSGKGVPASLFMMRTMIAIENLAANDRSPAGILTSLNKQICSNNKSGMFVTVWLGILDIKSGLMKAANAGHEYPVIRHPGGSFEILKDKHGFVIGGIKTMKYKEYELQMVPGTKLFVYTDGVPEARNEEDEMFRLERMVDALNRAADGTPEELIQSVDQSVHDFVQGAEQFDDLTMLCMSYYGSAGKDPVTERTEEEIVVDAMEEAIPDVKEFLMHRLREAGLSEKAIKQSLISAEELFENIALYAYKNSSLPEEEKTAKIRIRFTDDPKSAVITFIDQGIPYDPLAKKDPDITLKAKDRVPGGLGIFMSKKFMDDILYEYSEGRNILTIVKKIQDD